MSPVVVSPTRRVAVNTAPESVLPVVVSSPRDTPFTVRCVALDERPVTVRLLDSFTVDCALSRRVTVPVTLVATLTASVVLSGDCCTVPPAVLYEADDVIVSPPRVSLHSTRPDEELNTHVPRRLIPPNGPRPNPRPNPVPPKKSGPSPPIIPCPPAESRPSPGGP